MKSIIREATAKYYVSGPMSGRADHNFPAFDRATKNLRDLGYQVVSPAELARELPGEPGSLPYEEYMRRSLAGMMECTDLVLLTGWRNSRGARMELDIAEFLKFRVWRMEGKKLVRTDWGDTRV